MDEKHPEKIASTMDLLKWRHYNFNDVLFSGDELPFSVGGRRIHEFPYGIEGVDPLVSLLTTGKRFDQVVAICGPRAVLQTERFGDKSDSLRAILKIPEEEFETTLGLDRYHEDIEGACSSFVHRTCDHTPDNVCRRIVVGFKGLLFQFFGTEEVWRGVNAWYLTCEGIKRKQEVLGHVVIQQTFTRIRRFQVPKTTQPHPWEQNMASSLLHFYRRARRSGSIDLGSGQTSAAAFCKPWQQQDTEPGHNADVKYENRYEVAFEELRDIGKGSFGTVVEAKNKTDKKAYAVKKILKLPGEDIPMEKMLREVEVLAKLSHPNIVDYKQGWVEKATESDIKLYSWHTESSKSAMVGQDQAIYCGANCSPSGESSESMGPKEEGIPAMIYIQMELCKGSLADKLKADSPDSWIQNREHLFGTESWKERVLNILKQLLQAVDYIHSKNVIHTDLKPGNILYDEERELVKLGDFGLATHLKQQLPSSSQWSREPASGHFVWADKYCSPYDAPEQVKGRHCDSKVDIYSLGVVLAELLCLFEDSEEGFQKLSKLRSHDIPAALDGYKTEEKNVVDMVSQMCYTQARLRPTAKYLLNSGLVVTTDLIIKNLKAEVEEKDRQIELLLRTHYLEKEKAAAPQRHEEED